MATICLATTNKIRRIMNLLCRPRLIRIKMNILPMSLESYSYFVRIENFIHFTATKQQPFTFTG